ncbi:MAG: SDR family NAD(P)-dependent oxidoreductase [Verrucomicrobia bacterium]|nr:SDR family NAD(P)-dependent oxidoreductase [Verrucomicrobiota bacterium]
MSFNGKIAVVTGGASGMGNAVVRLLAQEGCAVYALDIQETKDAQHIPCDVSDHRQIQKAIAQVVAREKRIDLLFAAAGYHLFANIEQTSVEDFERILAVNLKGVFFVLKEVLPVMRAGKYGNIVLMGSDQVFVGKGGSSAYGLTKAAIGQLTKSTAIDYAPHNIRVNCICPGTIDTPMLQPTVERYHRASGIPLEDIYETLRKAQPIQRLGKAEEIARAVLFMLSDDCPFMTGALVCVDGGFTCQ